MIRFDRYSDATWHRAVTPEEARAVRNAIPYGHDLHVGHGGNRYTASLFRRADMELVSQAHAPRIVRACELALAEAPDTVVTVGADGYIRSIE